MPPVVQNPKFLQILQKAKTIFFTAISTLLIFSLTLDLRNCWHFVQAPEELCLYNNHLADFLVDIKTFFSTIFNLKFYVYVIHTFLIEEINKYV